jgi:hypothetical protein
MEAKLVITADDRATATIKKIASEIKGIGGITARLPGLAPGAGAIGRFAAGLGTVGTAALAAVGGITGVSLGLAGLGAVAGVAVKRFAELENTLKDIQITSGASKEEIAGLQKSLLLGAPQFGKTAQEAGAVIQDYVAQGLDLETAKGVLQPTLKTAVAYGADQTDISKLAGAGISQFGFTPQTIQQLFDINAAGGKEGQFELKDAARYLPGIYARAAAAGQGGENRARDAAFIQAWLQETRKKSGTGEEAANNVINAYQKLTAETTRERFSKEYGTDLDAYIKRARAAGGSDVDAIRTALQDVFAKQGAVSSVDQADVIKRIWTDQQAQVGMLALFSGKIDELTSKIIQQAPGSVNQDYDTRSGGLTQAFARLAAEVNTTATLFGNYLAPKIAPFVDGLASGLQKVNESFDAITSGMDSAIQAVRAPFDEIARQAGLVASALGNLGEAFSWLTKPLIDKDAIAKSLGFASQSAGAAIPFRPDGSVDYKALDEQQYGAAQKTQKPLGWADIAAKKSQVVKTEDMPGLDFDARQAKRAPSAPSGGGPIEAVVKPDQITARVDPVQVTGSAEITGSFAPLQVTVSMETSSVTRLIDAKVNAAKAELRSVVGSSGSNGRSLPEAAPSRSGAQ